MVCYFFAHCFHLLDPFDFKPDNNALQSILNNDGIRSTPSKRNTGVCCSPFNQVNLMKVMLDYLNNGQLALKTNFWSETKERNFRKEIIKIRKTSKFGCKML